MENLTSPNWLPSIMDVSYNNQISKPEVHLQSIQQKRDLRNKICSLYYELQLCGGQLRFQISVQSYFHNPIKTIYTYITAILVKLGISLRGPVSSASFDHGIYWHSSVLSNKTSAVVPARLQLKGTFIFIWIYPYMSTMNLTLMTG
jgi:hypothetical protein